MKIKVVVAVELDDYDRELIAAYNREFRERDTPNKLAYRAECRGFILHAVRNVLADAVEAWNIEQERMKGKE